MNKNEKNNCHYRDCAAITDNLSRIKNKKNVMPILPVGKIQGIFELNNKEVSSFLCLRGASGNQGISTSASCRKAHKRRFLFDSWILHFACTPFRITIPALAFLLSLNISESRAAWSDNCPSGTTAGTTCKTCGDNCAYTENSEHVVTIYGSGIIDYPWKTVNGISGYYDANNNPSPFYNNTSITGVQFAKGSNFTTIGNNAFSGASSLTSITIPDSVTRIGDYAFGGTGLTSITIPEGVTSIGEGAFSQASSLTSITLPDSLTSIGRDAFHYATSLTSITIPEGVTSIGDYAFMDDSSLTSITIPEGVTSIGNSAFAFDSSLTSITIPEGVTSIGDYAFYGATGLTSITIPEGVTSIGDRAFSGASSLESITLPGSLTSVGSYLFDDITGLTEINCAGTEAECTALESLLDEKGYLSGRTFNQVDPVTKCSSYTSGGCNACYSGYVLGDDSCHACGTGKNCHWDDTAEKVVFDGCKGKYLRKENECVASSQGCGANFRLNDGECDRIRYTPAEAAAILNDDDNEIVITFKK